MSLCRRVIRHSIKGDIKTKEVGNVSDKKLKFEILAVLADLWVEWSPKPPKTSLVTKMS